MRVFEHLLVSNGGEPRTYNESLRQYKGEKADFVVALHPHDDPLEEPLHVIDFGYIPNFQGLPHVRWH